MKYIIITLVAAIAATTIRVLFLEILGKIRQVHVDMIKQSAHFITDHTTMLY